MKAPPKYVLNILCALGSAGHEAVLAGGCVRDSLLGRRPSDWDAATSATPEEVLALFPRCVPTGIKHGTVTVLAPGGKRKAVLAEQLGQGARLVLVHLAAQRVKRKLQMAHLIFVHSGRHGAARPAIIQKEG